MADDGHGVRPDLGVQGLPESLCVVSGPDHLLSGHRGLEVGDAAVTVDDVDAGGVDAAHLRLQKQVGEVGTLRRAGNLYKEAESGAAG